jgi:hypothetical protein
MPGGEWVGAMPPPPAVPAQERRGVTFTFTHNVNFMVVQRQSNRLRSMVVCI